MAIRPTSKVMISDRTGHTARRVDPDEATGWELSWLPGRRVSRNQAMTGMVLAEFLASGVHPGQPRRWAHVTSWAGELGLTGEDAANRIVQRVTTAKKASAAAQMSLFEVAGQTEYDADQDDLDANSITERADASDSAGDAQADGWP